MTPTELELIAIRDHEAMARLHDRLGPIVGRPCVQTAGAERPRSAG